MYVVMNHSLGTPAGLYRQHRIYDVADDAAAEMIAKGLAAPSETPPPHVAEFYARLDEGAGLPCLFLPFVGEFGHQIMTHIRAVHWHRAGEKVVCCRPGDEVLYPSADRFVTDWTDPVEDHDRVATCRGNRPAWPDLAARFPDHVRIDGHGLTPEQELIAIRPDERIPFRPRRRGLYADVLLGVRARAFCPERNWDHWEALAAALTAAGHTFAVVGHKSTSYDLPGQQFHTGNIDTDAAIEAMGRCPLFVGTDSGASHLAATVGIDMLVFRETAWGSRDLTPRMLQVNKGRVLRLTGGWDRPADVIAAVLAAVLAAVGRFKA